MSGSLLDSAYSGLLGAEPLAGDQGTTQQIVVEEAVTHHWGNSEIPARGVRSGGRACLFAIFLAPGFSPLDPTLPKKGKHNRRWGLLVNAEVGR